MSASALPQLHLSDLLTLLAVQRTGSLSGAARDGRATPSQVSKAIARVERGFGARLFCRSARGVSTTAAGQMVLLRVARAIDALTAVATISNQGRPPALELTIAAPSYLAAIVLPAVVARLPKARVRMLEFVPAQLRACIVENAFDVAIIPGGLDRLPVAWAGSVAGVCRSGLLARPTLAKRLGPSPLTPDRVRALPFVGPIRTGADRIETMGDQSPMPRAARWIAHEAQTFSAALELASRSDCVVFGPVLAARRLLVAGELVEVPVVGWDVREPLHIMCNGDRVLSRVRDVVVRATRSAIDAEPPPVKVAVALTAASR